jgi:oxygen-independent coproporphyrinogen III oxidase
VPFCARRCSYCDFAIAVRRATPTAEFIDGIRRELSLRELVRGPIEPPPVETIYLGGGTPSRLGAAGVSDLLGAVRERVRVAVGAEVTLEANPEDVSHDAARGWAASGINRVSLGAQSFDDGVLRWMHRTHAARDVPRAVEAIRRAGIDNVSLDLIFALPAELGRDWERDLAMAVGLEPSHLSLYGLTVEGHTPLARWVERASVREAPDSAYEAEFLRAHDVVTAAGYAHYEVSNFARAGFASRHNAAYWSGAPYMGLGPSAHSYDGVSRRWNIAPYAAWLGAAMAGTDPKDGGEQLTAANRSTEAVYLGLRTRGGMVLTTESPLVPQWIDAGWAVLEGGRLRLTPLGWLRMDHMASALT